MIKGLKEKRNSLLGELETMVTAIEGETRGLTTDELKSFDDLKSQIENIDATLDRVSEMRMKDMPKEQVAKVVEKRSSEEMERRALDSFFRGEELDSEMRTMLSTSTSNQATMPLTIAQGILKRLEEVCPILNLAKRFSSKGTLRLLDETTYGEGALTPENEAFHDTDAEFGHIDLHAFKISAMTKATFELLANSSIDLDNYLTDVIIRRLGKELSKQLLISDGNKKPEGLIQGKQTINLSADLSYDDIVNMTTSLHPDFLDSASFIMNRNTFGKVALLQDAIGHKFVQNGVVNGKFTYTLGTLPIIIDNNMPDYKAGNKAIILANVQECYAINMLQDIVVRRLDQVEFANGVEVFAGYLLCDGRIINQDALKIGVVGAGAEVSKAKK